ncbi:MerR family transcriptional regulator [Levilactobacillus huananensis]|uniref:MerR family transcriptional regulator n=1 Tax=Levilactobacillus huananensis TaxID=2486019 RepID=UPI0013DDBD42|nr:MerR family transcriptional regulator [Levilactobacillus huananensis]
MNKNKLMRIGAFAKAANVTIRTVRYYLECGLLPPEKRNKNNQRVFDDEDLHWITNLHYLRAAGMSIIELQHYTTLVREGASSLPQRIELMREQRKHVIASIADKQAQLKVIDHKLERYLAGDSAVM